MKHIYIETADVIPYPEGARLRVTYRTSEQSEMEATSERKEWFGDTVIMTPDGQSMTMGVNDDCTPNYKEISTILEAI